MEVGFMNPVGKNILISPIEEAISQVIEIKNHDKPQKGIVLSVGQDVETVKEDDQVIFNKHHAHNLRIKDEDLIIIEEDSVYAIIKD